MKKIRLDADELRVLSFDTGAARVGGRTVEGYGDLVVATGEEREITTKSDDTRRYTCAPSIEDTACTHDHTCSPTACGISCDPYCVPDTV